MQVFVWYSVVLGNYQLLYILYHMSPKIVDNYSQDVTVYCPFLPLRTRSNYIMTSLPAYCLHRVAQWSREIVATMFASIVFTQGGPLDQGNNTQGTLLY